MFIYALDAVAPNNEVDISTLFESSLDVNGIVILILLLVILLCVAVGIVYTCVINKKKKSDTPNKEEPAEK